MVGDFEQNRIAYQGSARQRRPGNDLNVAAAAEVECTSLTITGVKFNLVDHRSDAGASKQWHQMVRKEVAHTDGSYNSLLVKVFEGSPGAGVDALPGHRFPLGGRPMNEEQIQIGQIHFLQGVIKGSHGGIVSAICIPELACDEKFLTRNATGTNGFTHTGFVAVNEGSVNVPITDVDSVVNVLNQFLVVRNLPGSKADTRNFDVICKTKAAGNGGQSETP